MCSVTEDAINQLAAAIDQLARDMQAGPAPAGTPGYAARVTAIWDMIITLDPGLARLVRRYTE